MDTTDAQDIERALMSVQRHGTPWVEWRPEVESAGADTIEFSFGVPVSDAMWDALCRMFPNRSKSGIATYARELGVRRGLASFLDAVSVVFAEGATANAMASYGFPLALPEARECPVPFSASRSPGDRSRG